MASNYLQRMAGNLGSGMGRRGMGVDPRRRMAQQLMAQGVDTSPARLGTGIGRLGKALAAAYMMRQSEDQETDAMKWLTAKQPTTQPTETEAYAASPDLAELKRASDVFSTVQWGSGQDQVQPDGVEKDLFKSGELKEETNWLDGLRDGKNTEYNEDGSVKKIVMWKRGEAISRTGDKEGTPRPPTSDPQFEKDFPLEEDLSEDSLFTADPEIPETPQEITSPYGRRDYAQELASGMGAYQRDPANQISDPRTRMEWLRDSASGKEDNPFVRRMLQNMMFSEMGLGREKSGRPASGIQYFDRKQELIKNGATQAELDEYDSYVRRAQVFDLGDSYQVRSGINPQGAQPTTINKNLPLDKKVPYIQDVEETKQKAKLGAKYMDDLTRMQPKAFSSLGSFKAKTGFMKDNVKQAIANISGWSTAYGAALSSWPRSQAQALSTLLQTIKANVGFQALTEMRENSPTGGALGQVSERELAYLQATLGDLAQTQDGEILTKKLKAMMAQVDGMHGRLQDAYDMTFQPLTEAQGGDGNQYYIPNPPPSGKKNRRQDDDPMNLGL